MLLFCTTGVVLRRLTIGNGLEGVRVVVVAEVCAIVLPVLCFMACIQSFGFCIRWRFKATWVEILVSHRLRNTRIRYNWLHYNQNIEKLQCGD
ncbi:hypothetical protein JB92DRAFT_3042071 [Gautieria morchelliformis]|nr:hypothetical protein JB92DRAFT_3042071 [Gautieria morchelliformis]